MVPTARLVIGGVLVGFGTKKGNGCTSGHGVCGLSALRIRSAVATGCFMVAAFVSAMASQTYSYLPSFKNEVDLTKGYATALVVIGASCALVLVSKAIAKQFPHIADQSPKLSWSPYYVFLLIQELSFGILFGLAMGVSNMTLLSAVVSFLDLRYWNPALGFVMGGAIAVTLPTFYFLFRRDELRPVEGAAAARPILDIKFYFAKSSVIDRNLIIGATVFGVGWGIFGACPGPALVNVGAGNIPPIIYAVAILFGMYLEYGSDILYKRLFPEEEGSLLVSAPVKETTKSDTDIESDFIHT